MQEKGSDDIPTWQVTINQYINEIHGDKMTQ
jgi:hypothetical protein